MRSSTAPHRNSNAEDIHLALEALKSDAAEIGKDVADFMGAVGEEMKGDIQSATAAAQRGAMRTVGAARLLVRKNPEAAIGVAAGVGLVVGLLLAGRRR